MPTLLIIFFILTLIRLVMGHLRLRVQLYGIPGPTGWPILGNALEMTAKGNQSLLSVLNKYVKNHGSRVLLWVGMNPYVGFANPKDIEKILSSQRHIEKSYDYSFLFPWLGTGLLTSTGDLWRSKRKMLTPAFHFSILEEFLPIICEQGDVLVEVLETKKGQTFDIFPFATRAALDIICETAMGKKINAQKESESEYVKAVYRISDLVLHRSLRPWLHSDMAWSWCPSGREEAKVLGILHGFTDKVIKERKQERQSGNTSRKALQKRPAFLDLLLDYQANLSDPSKTTIDSPPPLTDLAIREEVDTFMFEGHDTTAANINWTIYLLGLHPKAQAKVHEELDQVLHSTTGNMTSSDLSKLKYLENCIKESLRIYPSVPFFARKLNEELKLDDSTVLPPGTTVMNLVYQMHHNAEIYEDPEAFKPERFDDMEKTRAAYQYAPFSAGPRNCIGQKFAMMEEKIVLAKVFKKYKITSLQKPDELTLMAELILRPKEGIKIRLESRE